MLTLPSSGPRSNMLQWCGTLIQRKTYRRLRWYKDALLDMYARTMPERRVVSPKCFSSWDGAVYYRDEWTSVWCSCASVHGLVAVDISDDLTPKTRPSRHCNSMSYNIPVETKAYIQKSFLPRTITQWNHLPESVVTSSSLDTFTECVSDITH